MPRPTTSPEDRIQRLSEWDGPEERHLLWLGKLRQGKPALKIAGRNVHPTRVLLKIDDPLVQIRKEIICDHPRCINPKCFRVIRGTSFKYGRQGQWTAPVAGFSQFDLDEIEDAVATFNATGELPEFLSDNCLPEIKRRCNLA